MQALERFLEWGGLKKDIACLVLSGISLVISIFHLLPLPFDAAWVAIILCGVPILLEAFIGLVTAFDIKADVLVSIALIASVLIGEDFAAGEIAFIMQLGALLEDLTVAKARAGIEKLVHLTPQTARRLAGGQEEIIPAEQVCVGDLLRVLPGETIPVDGKIVSGETSINQAVMTGESLPVDKGPGDTVSSGTVNQFGAFDMRAVKVGEDSSLQRMIRLVQSADAGKAKIVGLADRWATWIVVIALTAAALTCNIRKLPHVADADGTACRKQNKAQTGFQSFSFHDPITPYFCLRGVFLPTGPRGRRSAALDCCAAERVCARPLTAAARRPFTSALVSSR
jgi:cation transport ATPase